MNKSQIEKRKAETKADRIKIAEFLTSSQTIAKPNVGNSAEYIMCSAIWFYDGINTYVHQPINITSGYVVCGRRHHNCFAIKAMLQGVKKERNTIDDIQGFLTNTDRFVDRKDALQIAILANQIIKRTGSSPTDLYSEDVW